MNRINVIFDLYEGLTKAVDYLNHHVFDDDFRNVVFLIQTKGQPRSRALAWFWAEKWRIDGEPYHEISLSAEHISDQSAGELVNTLIHELIHYRAFVRGIRDTDRTGNMHNKKFKMLGEELGCEFSQRDPKTGYSHFELGPELKKIAKDCIETVGLNEILKGFSRVMPEPKPREKKFFNYVCPGCDAEIKAPLHAQIICGSDGVVYKFSDALPETGRGRGEGDESLEEGD